MIEKGTINAINKKRGSVVYDDYGTIKEEIRKNENRGMDRYHVSLLLYW